MPAVGMGIWGLMPSLKNPVRVSKDHASSGPPSTFKAFIASISHGYATLYKYRQNLAVPMVTRQLC